MAFDPLKSNHYKLICVMKTDNNYRIDMYSSETDSWSPLEITFIPPNRMNLSDPVFCNSALHWYSLNETSLCVDVDRESLNTMPMPKLAQRGVRYFGAICILYWFNGAFLYNLMYWRMEMAADYSGWFVRYNVNLDTMRIESNFSALDIIGARKEEESIVVVSVDNEAISFNVHDMTSKKLCDRNLLPPAQGSSRYTCKWSKTFQYFESLTYFS